MFSSWDIFVQFVKFWNLYLIFFKYLFHKTKIPFKFFKQGVFSVLIALNKNVPGQTVLQIKCILDQLLFYLQINNLLIAISIQSSLLQLQNPDISIYLCITCWIKINIAKDLSLLNITLR